MTQVQRCSSADTNFVIECVLLPLPIPCLLFLLDHILYIQVLYYRCFWLELIQNVSTYIYSVDDKKERMYERKRERKGELRENDR